MGFELSEIALLGGLVLATIGAYWLYGKYKTENKATNLVLKALRWALIFLVFAIILKPFFESTELQLQPKQLIILEDISQSVASQVITPEIRSQFDIEGLETKWVPFAGSLATKDSLSNTSSTNIDLALREVAQTFDPERVAQIILLSDGVYNTGQNPIYTAQNSSTSIHTIALGDTTTYPDAKISAVKFNQKVFKGNQFPIVVDWVTEQIENKELTIILLENGNVIAEKKVKPNSAYATGQIQFLALAQSKGIKNYKVSITTLSEEKNKVNNQRVLPIEVIENQANLLVLYDAPHPDIAAITDPLQQKPAYKVMFKQHNKASAADIKKADLILYFQRQQNSSPIAISTQKPVWYFIAQGNNTRWTQRISGLKMPAGKSNGVQLKPNANFGLFNIPQEWMSSNLSNLPPLALPFGEYEVAPNSTILFHQGLGTLTTNYPVAGFSNANQVKNGFWLGSGIWQWKMAAKAQGLPSLDDIILSSCQYLLTKPFEKLLSVTPPKNLRANQMANWNATLINPSLESVKNANIILELTNNDSLAFQYALQPNANGYSKNFPLPKGTYEYKATATWEGQQETDRGSVFVSDYNAELQQNKANWSVLKEISTLTGGNFYTLAETANLKSFLSNQEFTPTGFQSKSKKHWVNSLLFFLALIALATSEWVIRKRNGLK